MNTVPGPIQSQAPVIPTVSGALFDIDYLKRKMKGYPVTENEFESLSNLTSQTTIWCAIGAFFAATLIQLVCTIVTLDDKQVVLVNLFRGGIAVSGIFMLVGFVVGIIFWVQKGSLIERIKRESSSG